MPSKHNRLYKTELWLKLRRVHLDKQPLCVRCENNGELTPATDVHHIVAHNGNHSLFNNADNLESLCHRCHSTIEQSIERRGYDTTVGNDGWPVDCDHPVNGGKPNARPAFSLPFNLKRSEACVHLVAGPPASGKSTFVRERAAPGDTVIDIDVDQADYYDRMSALKKRDAAIRRLHRLTAADTAWLVVSAPNGDERRAWQQALGRVVIHVLQSGRQTCRRRVLMDPRQLELIDDWYLKFSL